MGGEDILNEKKRLKCYKSVRETRNKDQKTEEEEEKRLKVKKREKQIYKKNSTKAKTGS